MRDVKQIKRELITAAAEREPPDSLIQQDDLLDMMIQSFYDPTASALQEHTLSAIAAGAGLNLEGAHLTPDRARVILLPDVRELKRTLLSTAAGKEPPDNIVNQRDILDEMLETYFNPCAAVSSEVTLSAIAAFARNSHAGGPLSEAQALKILDGFMQM